MTEKKAEAADVVASFMKLYVNLPLEERTRTVLVYKNQPISWEIARNEIVHGGERGMKILKKLSELKIV